MHSRKDHLPEWKLAQFDGNPLNWHKWFGQFKSTVDSAVLTYYTKLTYLKTPVTSKAKTAIAEFHYSGVTRFAIKNKKHPSSKKQMTLYLSSLEMYNFST